MRTADTLRRDGARTLQAAGVESAGHDAAELLAHVLDVEPGRLLLVDEVSDADTARFNTALDRRAAREPLQHITGRAWFDGIELAVGPGVFVPRPESELIAEWVSSLRVSTPLDQRLGTPLDQRLGTPQGAPLRVADLCSGSGALALAIARRLPDAEVTAVEISDTAVEYLRRNAAGTDVTVLAGDVTDLAAMAQALGTCDVIVANPPYVPAASPVSAEVRHDPAEAVFSGDTGMDVIAAMIPIVADALAPGGHFAVEHDDETSAAVVDALTADGRFHTVVAHTDLADRPRFVTAVRSGGNVGAADHSDRARMEP
ncbi:peptide chain release factor N(5)-glutamine methyltransferase [Gordonia sp. HY002]|uniref:peptide chain release factor N(5)-glutamine methyltransferase n=1 Tax=Gordonia zhenghanii TaxID=2911516 RepID=UPI001F00C390|nr:peptide chain release factor N(5)-glutamine methyltransferase [Gordonia zhenghanii]MCF8570627.1 peptide chain release factor N(5)-glutamine methyltransferase [Gordonia zhenghanii]